MAKGTVFAILLATAILIAGAFGALHNQLSYSVGQGYFHDYKFAQFGIAPDLHNRLGAALVGWRASWWMGLVAGLPAFGLGLVLMARPDAYFGAGLAAIFVVVLLSLMAAMGGLLLGLLWADAPMAQSIPVPDTVTDRTGFIRAALMHDASYLGGLIGLVAALWTIWRASRAERATLTARKPT